MTVCAYLMYVRNTTIVMNSDAWYVDCNLAQVVLIRSSGLFVLWSQWFRSVRSWHCLKLRLTPGHEMCKCSQVCLTFMIQTHSTKLTCTPQFRRRNSFIPLSEKTTTSNNSLKRCRNQIRDWGGHICLRWNIACHKIGKKFQSQKKKHMGGEEADRRLCTYADQRFHVHRSKHMLTQR